MTFRRVPLGEPGGVQVHDAWEDLRGLFRADVERALPGRALAPFDGELGAHLFLAEPLPPTVPSKVRVVDEEALPRTGAIIDKYRLEEVLGTGGFGVVYRATHLILQRPVALKLLRSRILERKPGLAELLCEEARFAARISHPNVVQVFDVTHSPELTYVVMEYVEGRTLAQTIKRDGRLDPEEVMSIGIDVASGLCAALESGIIHRDIKPQNILLTRNGPAKILDLGLARSTTEPPAWSRAPEREGVVGTYGYMAPEQVDHPEHVDFRADVYSLGVTLYQASTGVPPFPIDDPKECVEYHRSHPVPPPEAIVPDLPPPLSYLLRWMLAKDPSRRPSSYAVLSEAMHKTRNAISTKRGTSSMSPLR
jgi:serine/threonine-protein kinase